MESGAASKGRQGRLGTGYPLEDACRTILTISEKREKGQVYNIGRGNERKNIEIAKEILRCLSLPEVMIEFVCDRPGYDFRYSEL